jgi:hypothetical protein
MENKITKEELDVAVKHQEDLQKVILDLGVIETKKHAMLHKVADINLEIEEFKKVLEEKYGHVNINLEDGTYTEVEDEEDKKD